MQAGHDQKFKVVQRVASLLPVSNWVMPCDYVTGHDGKFETCDLLTFTPSHCGGVNVSMLCLTSHNEVT
jgi:hypothetical protein